MDAIHSRFVNQLFIDKEKKRSINVNHRFYIHNAGVGGSSPPVATILAGLNKTSQHPRKPTAIFTAYLPRHFSK